MTKRCKRCDLKKPLGAFSLAPKNRDGVVSFCKPCVSQKNKEYWQTAKGRISYIYTTQTSSSKVRGHTAPTYTKSELTNWLEQNGFPALMSAWKSSGFQTGIAPSVDRLDANQGYSLINIRLVTWAENNEKAYADRKACTHITKQNRKVRQLGLDGTLIQTFDSISAAARATGIQRTNINAMCNGTSQHKSVGGFLWEHA